MKRLKANITVGQYVFRGVFAISIESSFDKLMQISTIEINRKVRWQGKNIFLGESGLLKRGDRVVVESGYSKNTETVFEGYLNAVDTGIPVRLECQDNSYLLKTNPITKSFENASLGDVLAEILPQGIEYKNRDVDIGQLRLNNTTPLQVLDGLKKGYGVYSFFRDGVLYSGLPFWTDYQQEHVFNFQRNIISDSELKFRKKEDIKYKVRYISIKRDNSRQQYDAGDDDGLLRTYYAYNANITKLKELADAKLRVLKYDGFTGSFLAFGEPRVQQGDLVNITDEKYPEKDGRYLVRSVRYVFGMGGIRQKIEIGEKA